MPTIIRPSVSKSAAAISLARTAGWWIGALMIPVRKRMRLARCAAATKSPKGNGEQETNPCRSFPLSKRIVTELVGYGKGFVFPARRFLWDFFVAAAQRASAFAF